METIDYSIDQLCKSNDFDDKKLLFDLKNYYKKEIAKSVDPLDQNIFFWSKNFVTIYVINDALSGMIFATTHKNQSKDNIRIINLKEQTDNLQFKKMYSFDKKIAYFKKYDLFKLDSSERILKGSAKSIIISLKSFVTKWIENEYSLANDTLKLPAINLSYINENNIQQSKFQFREMLSNIDDDQFKAEFSEFLFGYNNEKFFLAASAMGSIIEHLIFIILSNYGDQNLIGSRHPQERHYLSAMERQNHFRFTDRDSTFIDNIFQTRNSISHYNSGYVLKSQCDMMLMGLNSIYRRFYLPSKAYRASHE